jgi:hypothetical protein
MAMTVTGISITPASVKLNKNTIFSFSATVSGTSDLSLFGEANIVDQSVKYEIVPVVGTVKSQLDWRGVLFVPLDETATTFNVKVTSTHNENVSAIAKVTVV